MIITGFRCPVLAYALLIVPITTGLAWQNTHALAKMLMNRNFMLNNPKDVPILYNVERLGKKKPVAEETTIPTEGNVKGTEILFDSKKEDSIHLNEGTIFSGSPEYDDSRTVVPTFVRKIELEPPANGAKQEVNEDGIKKSRQDPQSSIDTLVYGHTPEEQARPLNSAFLDDVTDGVKRDSSQEYDDDYYYSDNEFDQVADEASRTEVEVEVPDSEEVVIADETAAKKTKPTEIFPGDEDEAVKEDDSGEKEKDEEVKKEIGAGIDKKKRFFYDIPYGLFPPPYSPHRYVLMPHYPWLTMAEILWKLENSMLRLEQEAKEESDDEKMDVKEEVVESNGKKFLLKTMKTSFDPSETKHTYISLSSLTPVAIEAEDGEKKPSQVQTEEAQEKEQIET